MLALMNSLAAISRLVSCPATSRAICSSWGVSTCAAARPGPLAGGAQFGPGPGGESFHADRVEHREGGAQLVAGVAAAPLAAQPLAVQQPGAGQLGAEPGAGEPADRLAVAGLGGCSLAEQCAAARLES